MKGGDCAARSELVMTVAESTESTHEYASCDDDDRYGGREAI